MGGRFVASLFYERVNAVSRKRDSNREIERGRQKLRNVQMSEAKKERGREGWRDPSKVVTE